jgi:hypothetical protein
MCPEIILTADLSKSNEARLRNFGIFPNIIVNKDVKRFTLSSEDKI